MQNQYRYFPADAYSRHENRCQLVTFMWMVVAGTVLLGSSAVILAIEALAHPAIAEVAPPPSPKLVMTLPTLMNESIVAETQVLDHSYHRLKSIEPLGQLSSLRELNLRGVEVPGATQLPLHQLSELTRLEELDLSEIKSEWPADAFDAFRNCQQLRRLTLQSVRFSEQESYVLAPLGKLQALEELDLFGSTGYSLGGLQDCLSLRMLDIRHPAGRPQNSVRDLDPLMGNPTFRKLGTMRITKAQEKLLAVDLAWLQETGMRAEVMK